jgi:hypothetical protein
LPWNIHDGSKSISINNSRLSIEFRIYEHRRNPSETIFIGLFHRCENQLITVVSDTNKIYPICDENRYLPYSKNLSTIIKKLQPEEATRLCNVAGNPYRCTYTSVNKGLISSTVISAFTLSLSIILIYTHLLINQFKYKTHFGIAIITVSLLSLAFIFILITLILFGSTMSHDLFEYRYNLNYRLVEQSKSKKKKKNQSHISNFRTSKFNQCSRTNNSTNSSK